MSQLRDAKNELDALNIRVKIVTFDSDFLAKAYVKNSAIEWPLLLDSSDENTYNSYGLQRASWWTLYNPLSIIRYLYLMMTGTRPGKPGSDWNQLGGDVLIDPDGIVRMQYVSESPHDRPEVSAILETVRSSSVAATENHATAS